MFVAYQLIKRALPDIDAQQVLEDVSDSLGAWTYLIVGVLAFLETGAFVGLVAPGETVVVLAGAVAGQGATSVVLTIGIVWLGGLPRRHVQLLPRRAGSAAAGSSSTGRSCGSRRERFAQVETLLRQARRQDDPDRPLHRPGPGAGAVRRRQLGDARTGRWRPTACSAPGSGRRCSRCSATSPRATSTRCSATPSTRCSPSR